MSGTQARHLCPEAIVVHPRMSAYTDASRAVFEVFDDTTPLVEALSIDEAFLDVGGLGRVSGSPAEIAVRLRHDVLRRVGCRSRSASPGRSSSPRWRAASPSPTGCSSCHPTASSTSSIRCRSSGSGVSDRSPRPSCATAASRPSVKSPSRRAGARRHARLRIGPASARLAHNRDPRPIVVGRRRSSIGSQRARPPSPIGGRARRDRRPARRSRDPTPAHRRAPWPHGRAPFAFRRLLPRTCSTPFRATAHTGTISRRSALLAAARRPSPNGASRSSVSRSATSTTATRSSSCRSTASPVARFDVALDDVRDRFGSAAVRVRRCSASIRGSPSRCSPTERQRAPG